MEYKYKIDSRSLNSPLNDSLSSEWLINDRKTNQLQFLSLLAIQNTIYALTQLLLDDGQCNRLLNDVI